MPATKKLKTNCKKFKKTIDPKCNDQDGCGWTVGKGCLSSDTQPKSKLFVPKKSESKGVASKRISKETKECKKMGYENNWNGENVMLAHTFRDNKTGKVRNAPKGGTQAPNGWFVSEKFDGFRAIWDGKDFRSRTNRIFNAPGWFKLWMPPGIVLDGELFLGRCNFESCGLINRKIPRDEDWMHVKYQIFDAPKHPGMFEERYEYIKHLIKTRCDCKNLVDTQFNIQCPLILTTQTKVKNEKEMDKMFNKLIKNGAEGIMLRAPNSPYDNKRSSHLLKVKQLFDDECKIIGYKPGTGKYTGKLGAFKCELVKDKSKVFHLSGMPDSIRENYKKTHKLGTIITFTYMGMTKYGIPRHPNYLRKR
jgi:DNA ligase 1